MRACGVPRQAPGRQGRGNRECAASGKIVPAEDYVEDVRQGLVAKEYADITPGFGTWHPQDVRGGEAYDDPTPIENARPMDKLGLSKNDLSISDQECELAVREGRPPRPGY